MGLETFPVGLVVWVSTIASRCNELANTMMTTVMGGNVGSGVYYVVVCRLQVSNGSMFLHGQYPFFLHSTSSAELASVGFLLV